MTENNKHQRLSLYLSSECVRYLKDIQRELIVNEKRNVTMSSVVDSVVMFFKAQSDKLIAKEQAQRQKTLTKKKRKVVKKLKGKKR